MILTQQERDKFASYLEQEADTNKQFIEQMEKLPGGFPAISKMLKQDALAYAHVAAKLRTVEDQTIGAAKAAERKKK